MMSDFKWGASTVAANFPKFVAADLLTIGISSWQSWPYMALNSVFTTSGALGYAIWNKPQEETRAVNHSPAASLYNNENNKNNETHSNHNQTHNIILFR